MLLIVGSSSCPSVVFPYNIVLHKGEGGRRGAGFYLIQLLLSDCTMPSETGEAMMTSPDEGRRRRKRDLEEFVRHFFSIATSIS